MYLENTTDEKLHDSIKNRDEKENILVEKNIGLVCSVVKKYSNRGYEMEDLFQIGCVGLIKAVKKFDESYNVKFSTYAVPMIFGEIKRFIRDDGMIKVSRSLKELGIKSKAVINVLTKKLGREPTITELSEELGVETEELVFAMEAINRPESLHKIIGEGDGNTRFLIDNINCEDEMREQNIIENIDLSNVLRKLKGREKEIIQRRYFKDESQTEIAKKLGISQVQVSRLEKRILEDLKEKIGGG